jgi:peptide-methionine (S)-S-oxide reductase
MKKKFILFFTMSLFITSCTSNGQTKKISLKPKNGTAIAVFAEGCFWCSEHVFESVDGVSDVISGYSGGNTLDPDYKKVGTNTTGHAESVIVYYNPKIVSFKDLVTVFFDSHDPTTKDRQGPDVGSSYRSIVFYKTESEKEIIKETIRELSKNNTFKNPIVTEIKLLESFYAAEDYHQDYVKNNPNDSYVVNVSMPRYELFKKKYKGKLKPNS